MTYLARLMQRHSAVTRVMFACQMAYAIFKESVDLRFLVQAVLTEAGIYADHTHIAVGVVPTKGPCSWIQLTKLPLVPYNKKSGFPIVAAQYNGSKTSYCCGTASWNNQTNKIDCGNFESVSIPSGTAIPGVAGLSVKSPATESATNTTTPGSSNGGSSSNTSREAAIGAGVGVPLGVIAVASIIWALWERRTRLKAISTPLPMPVAESAVGTFHQPGTPQRFVELGAAHVSEIATSDRPKSHTESQ
jgi:hypothetical protein